MRWQTLAKRIDAVEQRIPQPEAPNNRDLSLLSDAEVDEMAAYSERIIAAGRPTDPGIVVRLFSADECERISALLHKIERPAQIGGW